MKRVQLTQFEAPDPTSNRTDRKRYYRIAIGNSYRVKFGSQKDAEKFLSDTSKFLTERMHELNFLYADIFSMYRSSWPYLAHSKQTSKLALRKIQSNCEHALADIQKTFNLLVDRSNWTNGNYFAFTHLNNITNMIDSVARDLIDLRKSQSAGVEARKLQILRDNLHQISHAMEKYGYEKAENPRPEDLHLKIVKTLAAG